MNDQLRPIREIVLERTGRRVSSVTQYRWIHVGVSGIKLQAWFLSGRWQTTMTAFDQFIEAQTKRRLQESEPAPGVTDDELRRAGLN